MSKISHINDIPLVPMMGRACQFDKYELSNIDNPDDINAGGIAGPKINYALLSNKERLDTEELANSLTHKEKKLPNLEQNLYSCEEALVETLATALAKSTKLNLDALKKICTDLIKKDSIEINNICDKLIKLSNMEYDQLFKKITEALDAELVNINTWITARILLNKGVAEVKKAKEASLQLAVRADLKKSKDVKGNIRCLRGNWLHNTTGPAYITNNGDKYWFVNGLLHRDNGPAVEFASGERHWYISGNLHRDNGPAIEYTNGDKKWYIRGKLHRDGEPAVIGFDGDKNYLAWYQNGVYHSVENTPTVLLPSGTRFYYANGEFHRTNGPALLFKDGYQLWYYNGIKQGY